jgi:hypothetical protein
MLGPRMTTNIDGKDKQRQGKIILMPAWRASSSARWRRLTRIWSAWLCSTSAMLTPRVLDWISTATKVRRSGTPVRSTMRCKATLRDVPMRISATERRNSLVSGLSQRSPTRSSADSKARPASTPMVSMSSASGRARWMVCWRWRTRRLSQ